nr:MAG TPA: hypothetical protein [Caudoviricetes sp.]
MGGRGSSGGGGKGRSGGGIGKGMTEPFVNADFKIGGAVKFTETKARYTTESGEQITKGISNTIDSKTTNNADGTTTRTNIVSGSKGNTYAVDLTYDRQGRVYTSGIRKVTGRTEKRASTVTKGNVRTLGDWKYIKAGNNQWLTYYKGKRQSNRTDKDIDWVFG